jgi:hypothetical protein
MPFLCHEFTAASLKRSIGRHNSLFPESSREEFAFHHKQDRPFLLSLEIGMPLYQFFRRQGFSKILHHKSTLPQGAKIILQGTTKIISFLRITYRHDTMINKPKIIIVGLPSDALSLLPPGRIF